jgi:uncharacterized protein (DUF302 family)
MHNGEAPLEAMRTNAEAAMIGRDGISREWIARALIVTAVASAVLGAWTWDGSGSRGMGEGLHAASPFRSGGKPMATSTGVVTLPSPHAFDQTLIRLRSAIAVHGLTLFLDLDQQAAAKADGVTMPRAHLLVFGRPRAGTPILVSVPEAGVDLPLKAYLWEAANGGVFVSYSDPQYLAERHHLSAALSAPLAAITPLVAGALTH